MTGQLSAVSYQRSAIGGQLSAVRCWLIVVTILVGAMLRVTNLTYHSIWFDEAVSIRWATSSAPRIIEVGMTLVEDRLPPLYYLLLKGWVGLGGLSEFSLRYLSVVFGVLLIAVVYALGSRLFNRRAGLLAALLIALNPFLIWYSQEARMYALAVLLSTFGVLCFILAINAPPPSPPTLLLPWLALGLSALAGLYTHLYTGFLWPALALWLLLNPRLLKRVWLPFSLTMGGVLLLFLPLAQAIWRFSGESTPGDPLADAWGRALDLFRAFIIWQAPLPDRLEQWVTVVSGLFLLLGVVMALRSRGGWLVVVLLLMPFLIASALLLRSDLAFFGQRYFIVMIPWIALLQAVGVGRLSAIGCRLSAIVGWAAAAGLLVIFTAVPIRGQWSVGAAKEAWRQTAAYMTAHVNPGDAVFIHPEWVRFPYQYYAARMKTPGQTYAAFFSVDDTTDLDGPLSGVVGAHPVVWLVQSHIEQPDPARRVENWFAARYPPVTELYPPGLILKAYAPGYQLEALPSTATAAAIAFPGGLRLAGYEAAETRLPARDDLFHPPSNWIHVTFYWRASEGVQDAVPYAHLLDEMGQVWGASLDRERDALRMYPPSMWRAGQMIRQDLDVNLNPATPPGAYQLVVGVGEQKVFISDIAILAGD